MVLYSQYMPLLARSDSFFFYFRSDGSNNDWGFKFTAEAEVMTGGVSESLNWLAQMELTIGCVLAVFYAVR